MHAIPKIINCISFGMGLLAPSVNPNQSLLDVTIYVNIAYFHRLNFLVKINILHVLCC